MSIDLGVDMGDRHTGDSSNQKVQRRRVLLKEVVVIHTPVRSILNGRIRPPDIDIYDYGASQD